MEHMLRRKDIFLILWYGTQAKENMLRRKDIFLILWYGTHAKEKGYSLLCGMEHMLRRKDIPYSVVWNTG